MNISFILAGGKSRLTRRPGTFNLLILTGLIVLATASSFSQVDSELAPKPIGKLIDIGGHRLHLICLGENGPVVVLEAGAGDFSFDWSLVQPGVARFARVCSYDRAGYAWSEPGPKPRTLEQIAWELHEGLSRAGLPGPYILVGHSLGGIMARVFTSRYPQEVAGLVLVDSSHEDQLIGITDRSTKESKIVHWRDLSRGRPIPPIQERYAPPAAGEEMLWRAPTLSAGSAIEAPFDKLPAAVQKARAWALVQPEYNPARFSEFELLPEELARLHEGKKANPHPLGDLPLVVITRGKYESLGGSTSEQKLLREDHQKIQADLVRLSTRGRQIIAKTAGHHIHLDDPGSVIEAIRLVVDASRRLESSR